MSSSSKIAKEKLRKFSPSAPAPNMLFALLPSIAPTVAIPSTESAASITLSASANASSFSVSSGTLTDIEICSPVISGSIVMPMRITSRMQITSSSTDNTSGTILNRKLKESAFP